MTGPNDRETRASRPRRSIAMVRRAALVVLFATLATLSKPPASNASEPEQTPRSGESGESDEDLSAILERVRQLEADLAQTKAALRDSEAREAARDERLTLTEDRLAAARQQVEAQEDLLSENGLLEEASSGLRSGISSFFEATDISGWVAASYNFNFNRNGNDGQIGQNSYALFPNSNSVQLDQAWISIDRPVSEDSRMGFHVDFHGGQHASFLDPNDDYDFYTAYLSYLIPLFEGVRVDAGRLAAATGYETIEVTRNHHITRGLTWQFQPITNTGIRFSAALPDGFSATVGVVNEAFATGSEDIDPNAFKTVTAGVGWAGDQVSVALTGYVGQESSLEPGQSTPNESGLIDLLILLRPNDRLELFANSNAFLHPDVNRVGRFVSVATGGRIQLLERLGFALRGEWARTEGPNFALDDDVDVWSITGTGDYALTDALTAKLELRYDRADDSAFFDSGGPADGNEDQDQLGILVQGIVGF